MCSVLVITLMYPVYASITNSVLYRRERGWVFKQSLECILELRM